MHICGFLVNNEGASLKRIENGAFNLFSHLIYALLLQILTDGKNVLSKCVSSDPHSHKPKLTGWRDPSKDYEFYSN